MLVILIFAFAFVVLFSTIVPYNMDEFIHYDTILCYLYPGNNLHGTCDPFKLNFLNTGFILPLRAYHYSGSFPSVYFLPIILLWSSPLAARSLGMVFMLLGGLIAARMFRFKPLHVFLGLGALFPYLFQHLVDTGPIGFHILSVFLIYALLDRWCSTLKTRYICAITLLLFCGIWTKFAYFWYVPGFAVFLLIHSIRHRRFLFTGRHLALFLGQSASALLVLLILVGSLLLSTAPDNPAFKPFLDTIIHSDALSFSELLHGVWWHSPVVTALIHPLEATQRVFEVIPANVPSLLYSVVIYLSVPLILFILLLTERKFIDRKHLLVPAALMVAFFLTVVMIARTKGAGAMHHAILSYPFLILATLATIRCLLDAVAHSSRTWLRWILIVWLAAYVIVNLIFCIKFPTQPYRFHDDPEKFLVHTMINTGSIPDRTMVLVVDWGMFYYSGLFGSSKKSVLFEWGLKDEARIRALQDLAHRNGRKIVVLYTSRETASNLPLIQQVVPLERCAATPLNAAWVLLFEPDAELNEICNAYTLMQHAPVAQQLLLRASLTQ
ncbi:MAG: hypothetical protein PHX87_05285 [Candidatus Peribacteraceae bacterium]|nr:hypothetical protein [Candidatus Peribacteraceae bacterium]MDD5742809.1 hypothetical protein [Candidatus Peribacteraceae bacterium]